MRVFKKIVILFMIWIIYYVLYKLCYPISTIQAVNYQLTNSPVSSSSLSLQQILWDGAFIIPALLSIQLFIKEIKHTIKNVKEKLSK